MKTTTKTTKMDPKLKAKWVAALRSGEYLQGDGYLVQVDGDDEEDGEHKFCCLGVLCDIVRDDKRNPGYDWAENYGLIRFAGNGQLLDTELNDELRELVGLPEEVQDELINFNDGHYNQKTGNYDQPWSFKKIATYIEKNL